MSTPSPRTHSSRSYGTVAWKAGFAAAVLVAFGPGAMVAGAFPFLADALSHAFAWPPSLVFALFGVSVLVAPLFLPLSGRWIDRQGPRAVALPATLAYGVATLALAAANGSPALTAVLLLVWAVCGFVATFGPAVQVVSLWFNRDLGLALAVVLGVAGSVGGAISAPAVQWVIAEHGWRVACLAMGAALLMVCGPVQVAWLRVPVAAEVGRRDAARVLMGASQAGASLPGLSLSIALRSRSFWLSLLCLGTGVFAIMGVRQHGVALLGERGYSAQQVAWSFSVMFGCAIIGQLAAGVVLDRFSSPKVILPFVVAPLLGLLLIRQTPAAPQWLCMSMGAMGLANGAELTIGPYFVRRFFGPQSFTQIQGALMAGLTVLMGLAPVVLGVVHDAQGTFDGALLALQGAVAFSVLPLLALPRYRYAADQDAVPRVAGAPAAV